MFGRISCLRALILNPDQIQWHCGELGGGGGNLKSWKTVRVEGSGWNLVGKIITSPRYVIDITRTDPLSLGELGRRVNSEKLGKNELFLTYKGVIGSRSLDQALKWNLIFGRISCLRALILISPDRIWWHLGGVGRNLISWKTLRVEGSGWNLLGKISTSPRYVIDITGTDSLSLGELGWGKVKSKKLEKNEAFSTNEGVIRS